MRKFLFIAFAILSLKAKGSNFVYVPDSLFRVYIGSIAPGSIVGDSMNKTNSIVTTLDSMNITGLGIANIEGMEYFTALKIVHASANTISSLTPLPAGLQYLNIDSNAIYAINSLPTGLINLYSNNCSLFEIHSLPATLKTLDCRNNKLLCLPTLPNLLISLLAAQNYMNCLPNIPTAVGFTSDIAIDDTTYTICGAGVCNRYDTISGYAYMDLNNNGIWDAGEPALGNQAIIILPIPTTTITDSNGYYSFAGHPGIIETIQPDSLTYARYKPDSIPVLLNAPLSDTGNLNFGFHYVDTFFDARVFATEVIRAIPGQESEYLLTLDNHGARADTGTLMFIFSPLFTYASSQPAATLSGDTLKWTFTNLLPGVMMDYTIKLNARNSDTAGMVFYDTAYVSITDSDAFPANNLAVITDTIVKSYQRNNKTVSPKNYTGADFQAGDYFDYNITFQNTDSIPVSHVWLIDTLSPYFDMSTLYVVAASAPYVLTISGNALRVDFNNINLPDSASNQAGSHGFFRFLIRPLSAAYVGLIRNTAYIYLDGLLVTVGTQTNTCLSVLNIYLITEPEIFVPGCTTPIKGSATVVATTGNSPYSYEWSNGALTGPTQSGLSYGQYYVTVTDNCITTAIGMPYVDTIQRVEIIATATFTGPTCLYSNNGSAIIAACGGYLPYSYRWSNGQTGDTATSLIAGYNYYCTVSDTAGDSTTVRVYLTSRDSLSDDDISYLSCSAYLLSTNVNDNLGSAIVIPTGVPPYHVDWSNGEFGDTIYNLQTGSYSVTVSDSLGCTIKDTFSILTVYTAVHFNALAIIPHCQDSSSTTLIYSISGATLIYASTGTWQGYVTNGTGSITTSNNPPFFELSVWGNLGYCPSSGWDTIVTTYIYGNPVNVDADVQSEPTCSYDSNGIMAVLVNDTLAEAGENWNAEYNFALSNGSTGTYYAYDWLYNLEPGTYTVTVTDVYSCTASTSVTFNASDPIIIDQSIVKNVSCYGAANGSIQIIPGGGSGSYLYKWSNNEHAATDSLLPPGNYSTTVIDSLIGCTVSGNYTVTQPPDSLTVNATVNSGICAAEDSASIELTITGGTPGYFYRWSNNEYAANDTQLIAGTYVCTITDANGCQLTDSFTITGNDLLSVAVVEIKNVSCYKDSNGSIELLAYNGIGSYIYNWSNGVQSATDTALFAGTYTCTITDSTGCAVHSTNTIIQPDSLYLKGIIDSISCYGADDGNIILTGHGGTMPYSFTYPNGFNPPLGPGRYVTDVTDAKGCATSDTFNLSQPSLITDTAIVKNIICPVENDGSIQLMVSGGTPGYFYHWSNNENGAKDSLLVLGNYTCTINDANGCTLLYTGNVMPGADTSLYPIIIYVSTQNLNCYDGEDGQILLTPIGGAGNYNYLWSNNQQGPDNTQLPAGTYTCTITDANGCTADINNVTLTQPDSLWVIAHSVNPTCFDSTNGYIALIVSGGTGAYSYLWNNSVTTSVDSNLTAGTYEYTVTDANGCTIANDAVLTQPDTLSIMVNSTNTTCFDSANGGISLAVTGGAGNYTYRWSNNANDSTNALLAAGTYSCTITDGNGCSITDSFTVTQPDSLKALFTFQEPTCGSASGAITLDSATGGTRPYTLHWSNGDTGTSINNISSGVYYLTITDNNGCVYTYSDSVPCITDIANITADGLLEVYPNPAADYAIVDYGFTDWSKPQPNLEICNALGQVVYQQILPMYSGLQKIDVSNLAGGMYVVFIKRQNGVVATGKLVKQ